MVSKLLGIQRAKINKITHKIANARRWVAKIMSCFSASRLTRNAKCHFSSEKSSYSTGRIYVFLRSQLVFFSKSFVTACEICFEKNASLKKAEFSFKVNSRFIATTEEYYLNYLWSFFKKTISDFSNRLLTFL